MKINQKNSVWASYNTNIFAGRAFMNIFAHVNFIIESQARIKLLTIWTTFTELFCAIRIMCSVCSQFGFYDMISLIILFPAGSES